MFIIYLSGIDGCGKTTQAKRLAAWLTSRGLAAEYQWLRWQPSALKAIRAFRALFASRRRANRANTVGAENESHDDWARRKHGLLRVPIFRNLWLSYATRDYLRAWRRASRAWRSDYVVLDRYQFDFVVDQSLNLGMRPLDFLGLIDSSPLREMRKPDLSIFIHLPPEVAWKRKQDGTSLNYLSRRAECYRAMPPSDSVLHVDGARDIEAIHEEIARWVDERIGEAAR